MTIPGLRRKAVIAAYFAAGMFFVPFAASMDWPSPSGKMLNNFGWNNEGRPALGIAFEDEGEVLAAEQGELLYQSREGNRASRLPSPLGSWFALDHGDGIISIYSRLEDPQPPLPPKTAKGAALAASGISGWSKTRGFYFSLFDRKERRWINPSIIIKPPEDTRPPVISSVRLKNPEGRLLNPAQTPNISQGKYVISVGALDTRLGPGEPPLAPYRIVCMVNGREAGVLNFETYSARDGALMVYRNGLIPVRDIYAPYPAYEVGEVWFTRGQATLEVIAQDISGNTRNVVYRLTVE
jgi:hypothetical protein